jgi:hypothetical protein
MAKAVADFATGERDEALYGLVDLAGGVGLAYRNGWRGARMAAERAAEGVAVAEIQPATAQNPRTTVENPDGNPFADSPVSTFASPFEVAEPTQAISAPPPTEMPAGPTSREFDVQDGAPRAFPTKQDVRLAVGEEPPKKPKAEPSDQMSLF